MRTRRLFLNRLDPAHEPTDAVVVIDVLRSFTTAAYAYAAGASTIYPVETISRAFRLQRRLPDAATTGAVGGGDPIPGRCLPPAWSLAVRRPGRCANCRWRRCAS